VTNWLQRNQLESLVQVFKVGNVNGSALLNITAENVGLIFPALDAGQKLNLLGALKYLGPNPSPPGLFNLPSPLWL